MSAPVYGRGDLCARARGFTFLELLLVVILLALVAGMAFPRLSDVYGQMRYERQKSALSRLLVHGERQARLAGRSCWLAWDEKEHRFLLRWWKDELDYYASRGVFAQDGTGVAVDAERFARFALDNGVFARRGGPEPGARESSLISLAGAEDLEAALAELKIDRSTSVQTFSLPLRIDASGLFSRASIFLSRDRGGTEEFLIAGIGSQWRRR